MAGTEKVLGFKMVTQRPLNEWYLNEGVAWVDTDAVLAGIPSGSRSDGLKVRIGTVDYEFLADLVTLQPVAQTNDQTAAEVPIDDAGGIFDSDNVEDALQEVKLISDANATALGSITRTVYEVNLPAGDLTTKVAAPTFTPTGWATIAKSGESDALITHTLTGRKPSAIKVWEIDGSIETLTKDFSDAFSGVQVGSGTVLIIGLNPTTLALRVSFIFN